MIEFPFEMPEGSKRNRADDIIDDLIEKVISAYPPERLERIKNRSEATWKRTDADNIYDDRISYVVLNTAIPREPEIPPDADYMQRDIIYQLKMMLHNSVIDDEYYPAFSSGLEQVTIPSMFGCVKECISGSEHIKPVIKKPSDVFSLPEAEIREGLMCYDMLYRMAYKYRRAKARIPIYMTDIQGPFSCAAQMWNIQDFLCDLDEYTSEAHHLLSLCTDAIIKYFHAMYDVIGVDMIPIHCHPVIWIPKDCGVAVSDDFFAIVGANTVKEFSMPYLEKIGEKFGGITAHTCGNMNHLVQLMNEMKHLKAVNFSATETDLMKYAGECDTRITLLVHRSSLSIGGLPLLNAGDHIRHCADAYKNTGVKVFAMPMYTDEPLNSFNIKQWENAAKL